MSDSICLKIWLIALFHFFLAAPEKMNRKRKNRMKQTTATHQTNKLSHFWAKILFWLAKIYETLVKQNVANSTNMLANPSSHI